MANFVFYDVETTGLSRDFDQILQFAAIQTDSNLNQLDRFEVRCRLLPWVVPSPIAMAVTNVSPSTISDPKLPSHYEAMGRIYEKLEEWSPSTFLGYNSMRFDEPLLQRAFWHSLKPPFVTVAPGNSRTDLLPLVQANTSLSSSTLVIPRNSDGDLTYKLDRLAPANGFNHENAHDALSDVEATIHIAKQLATKSRELWQVVTKRSHKRNTSELLSNSDIVLMVEHFNNRSEFWWGLRIDENGTRTSSATIARIDQRWQPHLQSQDRIPRDFLENSPRPVREVALNKSPLVFSELEARSLFGIVPSADTLEIAGMIRVAANLRADVVEQIKAKPNNWPAPIHLEQKVFLAFPSRADESTMRRFHRSSWSRKFDILTQFEDSRFAQVGQRILFDNAPDAMPRSAREKMLASVRERLSPNLEREQVPWRTVNGALSELRELRKLNVASDKISEIEQWLLTLLDQSNKNS